jgi:hypothetical protein
MASTSPITASRTSGPGRAVAPGSTGSGIPPRWGRPRSCGLLAHADVSTTVVYTHVLNRGGLGVRSPADVLGDQ